MRAIETLHRVEATGCADLGERGLVDTARCCEACHSADIYAPGPVPGPCRAGLPDGEEVSVCCSAKGQMRRTERDGNTAGQRDPRDVKETMRI